jgi:hypothetical protein
MDGWLGWQELAAGAVIYRLCRRRWRVVSTELTCVASSFRLADLKRGGPMVERQRFSDDVDGCDRICSSRLEPDVWLAVSARVGSGLLSRGGNARSELRRGVTVTAGGQLTNPNHA